MIEHVSESGSSRGGVSENSRQNFPRFADTFPERARPALEHVNDIDDWLAGIATGRSVGITAESTVTQYRRDGIAFRLVGDAPRVPVRVLWRRHDPHPATFAAVALLSELYGERRRS
ncbi:hypothetical protein [Nocardiopsis sp. CNS-639]|uniref:hypothetical protein n=1 Tax=Nocardiopsis sp. CNS-639 TaxID=1169153 RepID=UPI001E2FDB1C